MSTEKAVRKELTYFKGELKASERIVRQAFKKYSRDTVEMAIRRMGDMRQNIRALEWVLKQ